MIRTTALLALVAFLGGCGGGAGGAAGGRAVVTGAGADDFLRLRAGPGLGYAATLGLPDGTEVVRNGCVTEVGQLWCRVALAEAPQISGYVAADYLADPAGR